MAELEIEIDWMISLIYLNKDPVIEPLRKEIERRLWIMVGIIDYGVDFQALYERYCTQRRQDTYEEYVHFAL